MEAKDSNYFAAFVNISKAISSTLNLPKVLELILARAVESLDMKAGALSLWNKKKNSLELITQLNLSSAFINKGPIMADRSIPDTLKYKKPVIVSNTENDSRIQYPDALKKEGIQSILSVPIVHKDDVIGTIRLYDTKPREFSGMDIEFITAVAEQGGIAIENARHVNKVKNDYEKKMDDLWDWFNQFYDTYRIMDG